MARWVKSVVVAMAIGTLAFGCVNTAESATDVVDSPEVDTDGLESQDFGTSWNGWDMTVGASVINGGSVYYFVAQTLTFGRSFGDATRGGGICTVLQKSGSSCTNDAAGDTACTTGAVAQFGAGAYGYCYNSVCYHRPGTAAAYCSQNPNRAPGSWTNVIATPSTPIVAGYSAVPLTIGCMTKTAGPNPACGGTNQSLYMRTVQPSLLW
jgi:hypothetical protein